jgi:hypothetical protein
MAADELAAYLRSRLPVGVQFEDAVQSCMRLFCTVDGIPQYLHNWASRDHLPDAFASLGARGWMHNPAHDVDVSSREFWLSVVSSVTVPSRWVFNVDGSEAAMAPFIGIS